MRRVQRQAKSWNHGSEIGRGTAKISGSIKNAQINGRAWASLFFGQSYSTGIFADYLDTTVPVGATDLLASYTYRIAFQDSGQNYALACAISSIVFRTVATLAVVNLKLFKVGREAA